MILQQDLGKEEVIIMGSHGSVVHWCSLCQGSTACTLRPLCLVAALKLGTW